MQIKKIALAASFTGWDKASLKEFLLSKNYIVTDKKCSDSLFNTDRIDHLYRDRNKDHKHLFLHYGDLSDDTTSSNNIINQFKRALGYLQLNL